ncbi:MAG: hypothetical protein HOB26_11320, partial [Flavobacteriales bacterium]|nr:hypothetical protein [Flavobacteriales bacterium]
LPKANNALSEELKNVPVDDQIKTTKKVVPIMASKKPDPVELITPIADSPSQEVEFEIDTTNLDKPADNSKKKGEPITPSDEEDEGQLGLF